MEKEVYVKDETQIFAGVAKLKENTPQSIEELDFDAVLQLIK